MVELYVQSYVLKNSLIRAYENLQVSGIPQDLVVTISSDVSFSEGGGTHHAPMDLPVT